MKLDPPSILILEESRTLNLSSQRQIWHPIMTWKISNKGGEEKEKRGEERRGGGKEEVGGVGGEVGITREVILRVALPFHKKWNDTRKASPSREYYIDKYFYS